ncbi:hypothetical protein OOZ19_00205 [Saccharopolyspora sp. NFXS83]|uniref:hypothetical protein n=1 Tax=Saccharopolyspora sp. NFXS83 TaxID=2993560 RepID=UPI00224A4D44|nr:hypothetical protein [Saccharopolyspora sp. NFXS83]MCX2728651.1 hypothetical protein [Saccharopolyspora sp. NFXS83]
MISVLATVFAVVHMRWFAPLAAEGGWFTTFTQGVPVFPANCLCGFAIGVAFGAVLRRTVPAMAATLVGSVVWSLVVWIGLRPHYLSPVISRPTEAVRDSFIVGHPGIDLVSCHPAERFWLFQGIEAGLLVATALALFAFTGWWLRRISV